MGRAEDTRTAGPPVSGYVHRPAISTVHAVLDRHGMVEHCKRRRNKATGTPLQTANRVMKTRAKSLEGLLAKVKVRRRWNTDDEASEILILKSLVADIKAIVGGGVS